MESKQTILKCKYKKCNCNNEILLDNNSINNIVRYGNAYYHSECFISWCNEGIGRHKNNQKYKDMLSNIDAYKEDAYKHLVNRIENDELYNFIMDKYDVKTLDTYVYIKLTRIFNGTLEGIREGGIPKEHFFDMWKRKSHQLDKIHQQNIVKGKNMTPTQTIMYDISVLINKYDSYLKWLEKEKIIQAEANYNNKSTQLLTREIRSRRENNIVEKDDISKLVNDIFDE